VKDHKLNCDLWSLCRMSLVFGDVHQPEGVRGGCGETAVDEVLAGGHIYKVAPALAPCREAKESLLGHDSSDPISTATMPRS
jgi:hypothetical protein